jgi:hypothetical protein
VGGGYALHRHTGIERHTRDFDLFLLPDDVPRAVALLARAGHDTRFTFPHWLAKVHHGDEYVDLIFSSGNGLARVDSTWFDHAVPGQVIGLEARLCAAEEMIWSKAYIMERERFDGADILHLIRERGLTLDWQRLLGRFGRYSRVLLAHLVIFGFVYPQERDRVPDWVMRDLLDRLDEPIGRRGERLCLGHLLSRSQYLPDLDWGYRDGRLAPYGTMTPGEIEIWTRAADEPEPHG